ncbi:MAG TPA: SusC/RagA family TonB-linked outer membrane protein [Pedobacter sp.]|uniref:SusC/RagA family TonB-linked outer membrane protein n=1 Tax=Pedobacter sp. TaxID=1411316 RepID=UPI002C660607|nr:SusC/RagA family TonB-linked outer membrane protein [Pedobacter sp.]HMI01265.1 SusC/RagA family TonB-linked outer membrane protein [Pedobacter sp.]
MKLTVIFLIAAFLQVSAAVNAQKLTIKENNISLDRVFKEIHKQTGYTFLYTEEMLNESKSIDLRFTNSPLEKVLKFIFSNQPLTYAIKDQVIVIKRKTETIASGLHTPPADVQGKILDEKGNFMPGVTIKVKDTNNGTTSGSNGEFVLKNVPENAILVISYVGYVVQEVKADAQFAMTIKLVPKLDNLNEVVVIGYGTSTKRKINSAVSTLNMENVAPLPVQSINDAVAGRMQGIIVTSSTGAPGAKSTVSIRGGSTPLYVIDNQVRTANDFSNLNPNDIESYSVLKDVGATALYGQQGSNGVIMVTTKKGREGQVNINYSFNQIFSQPTLFPKRLSSYETLDAINQVYIAEGRTQPTADDILALYKDQSQPFLYPNTDWRDIALKSHSPEQRHDFSISSGNKALTYYASGSYFNQGTNLKTDNNYNKRITYRLNTVSTFDDIHLKVTAGLDGFVENNSVPLSSTASGYNNIYQHIQQKGSGSLAYNEFGLPYNGTTDNPAIELSSLSGYAKNTSRVFNSILGLDYEAPFLSGLHFKATGSYNMWNSMGKSWSATAPSYALNSNTPILGNPPSLSGTRGDGSTLSLQGFVTYNKSFGDHNIDFTAVYEQAQDKVNSLSAGRRNYQIIYDQFNTGPTVDQSANGSEYETARAGYIGRLSYNYKSKYFIDGTIRYDGNAAFPKGSQWGAFYSFSGGYVISEESFMQSLKDKHILDYLKIRSSFGLVGQLGGSAVNADGVNLYAYVPGYTVNPNAWVIDGKPVQGTSEPGSLPSTSFSWFDDKERNIGLDLATLNSRLSASVDYFYKRTTGYVGSDTRFAQTLGIGLPPINFTAAAKRREGTEFNVTWNDKSSDFTYKIGVNFTYFNELWERTTTEDEAALKNPYTRVSGNSQTALTSGLYNMGFYANNSDLLNGPRRVNSINVVAGDLMYQDLNGDGQITDADNRLIGSSSFPRINYGTTIDLGYKGIFLSAVVMGSGNRDRYISGVVQGGSAQNLLVYGFQQDYWTPNNTDALFPRQVSSAGVNGGNNYVTSDFWILKSSFVRLKYLQLGYDLKNGWLEKSPFKQFKVFISGTNLLTSAKSQKYFIDPESNENNEDYPIQRTFALGLNIGF